MTDVVQKAVTTLGLSVKEIYRQAYQPDPVNETWACGLYQRSGVITATAERWCEMKLNDLAIEELRQTELFDRKYGHLGATFP